MRRFSVFIVLIITFSSCIEMIGGASKAINENANKSAESISEHNFQTVAVEDLYELSIPKYMKEMNLHPEASLQYANIYKEAYVAVIHEDKQDFIDIFTELNEYDSQLSPIENYEIVQKKMFEESISNSRFNNYGLTSINGYPAKQIKMTGNVDGIDIFYVISFIEGTENIYMIMNWTIKNRFEKFENTFEYISGTFKLIENNEVSESI